MHNNIKRTLVLGASPNPSRYAYRAVNLLKAHQHPVVPVGIRKGSISGQDIITEKVYPEEPIDTVTLYLSPDRQKAYYRYILDLKPKRIIFNPGTENPELILLAKQHGIKTEIACTLVLLTVGAY